MLVQKCLAAIVISDSVPCGSTRAGARSRDRYRLRWRENG